MRALLFLFFALVLSEAALAGHETPKGGERPRDAAVAADVVIKGLKEKTKLTIELDTDYFREPGTAVDPKRVKKTVINNADKAQAIRTRLIQIKVYLDDLKKHCPKGEQSTRLAKYLESFLLKLSSGWTLGDEPSWKVEEVEIARALGGLTAFFKAKRDVYKNLTSTLRSKDSHLVETVRDLMELAGGAIDGIEDDIHEEPLSQAIAGLRGGEEQPCAFGAEKALDAAYNGGAGSKPESTPPTADADKIDIQDAAGKSLGKKVTLEAGEKFRISVPVKDDSGFDPTRENYVYLNGDNKQIQGKGKYNPKTGAVELEFESTPYLPGGEYSNFSLNIADKHGNNLYQDLSGKVSVTIKAKTPDTEGPKVHLDKRVVKVGDKVVKGDEIAAKAGDKVTITIPVTDDVSGVPPGATPSLSMQYDDVFSNIAGKYDEKAKLMTFEIPFNPYARGGEYSLQSINGPSDVAGNYSNTSINGKIKIKLESPNEDTTAPTVDFDSLAFDRATERHASGVAAQRSGGTPVKFSLDAFDDISGVATVQAGFLRPNETYQTGFEGKLDPKTGKVTFEANFYDPGVHRLTSITVIDKAGNRVDVPVKKSFAIRVPPPLTVPDSYSR